MLTRRKLLAAALAAPALLPRASLGENRKVKIGSAFTTTTNAAFLMPQYLREVGVDAEIVLFPSLVQRMQAVASGDVQVGNGGLSATMQVDVKGFPMVVLANGCDGGWALLARKGITSLADLKGRKIAVQQGSIGLVSLLWKLKEQNLSSSVELVYLDNDKQPIPLSRGDVDAICCFEPYSGFAKVNGWGQPIWDVYETPMGKTNLGFVASQAFVDKEPELTKLILAAHVRATNEVKNNPAIALETTMKQFNMPREVATISNSNLFFSAESGPAFRDGLKNLAKMMVENRLLDREPDWDRFVNTKFL